MREIILLATMAALTGCGGAVGGSTANTANTANAANAANTTAAVPKKMSEPYAMHSAPKLVELMEKYSDSIDSSFKGKDFVVIGKVFRADSSGIYFNQSSSSVQCEMSSEAKADKKFADVEAAVAKSQSPIVEVRGIFAEGSVSKSSTSAKLSDCTIVSIAGTTTSY